MSGNQLRSNQLKRKRSPSPSPDCPQSLVLCVTDTTKFNTTKRHINETLSHYHDRLLDILINCPCSERVHQERIRKRLLLAVDKKVQRELLALTAEPTVDQIVCKHINHQISVMVPKRLENVPQFHKRLNNQAKECTCASSIHQQMIEKRLVLALKPELRKELLKVNALPTAEDIMDLYNKLQCFQNHSAWPQVLSYLNLFDLDNFAKSHSALKVIVDSFLQKGYPLIIDEECVLRLQQQASKYYKRYSQHSKELVLNGIPNWALDQIFKSFGHIEELTLSRLEGSITSKKPLVNLTKLTLINHISEVSSLVYWFSRHNPCLSSVHLEGNSLIDLQIPPQHRSLSPNGEYDFLPQLQSLTIGWGGLNYKSLKRFRELKHLKVKQGVDWKHKQEIDELNLTTVDIFCYEIPKQDNQILKLNEDCILHLRGFLTDLDWVCFLVSHPRLSNLPVTSFTINKDTLRRLPLTKYRELFDRFGPMVSSLVVVQISYTDCRAWLRYFTNLKELNILYDTSVDAQFINCIPKGIQKLSLTGQRIKHNDALMTDLFRRLNPTLNSLYINYGTGIGGVLYEGTGMLKNIQEYSGVKVLMSEGLCQFLTANALTMLRLNMYGVQWCSSLVKVVSKMKNLKRLKLTVNCMTKEMSPFPGGNGLPNLEFLYLKRWGVTKPEHSIKDFISSLNGSRLTSFTYKGGPEEDIGSVICEQMRNLESMDLDIDCPCLFTGVKKLAKLQRLIVYDVEDGNLLPLVKNLPLLKDLQLLSGKSLRWETICEARRCLRAKSGTMVFK